MTNPSWTPQQQALADLRHTGSAVQAAQGDDPLEQLVGVNDPDWAAYQSDDPAYFLKAASRIIRDYVGWHIYPNIETTKTSIPLGARGIIILPSRHVTQVDSLVIQHGRVDGDADDTPPTWVNPNDYEWFESGYIQRKGWAFWAGWYYASYYYGNDPYYLPQWDTGFATVKFHHGYDVLPEAVKSVAFELAEQAMAIRTGNIKQLESPGGYRMSTSQNMGLNLNDEQRNRLANYRTGFTA
jgi:hypothetical protein